MKNVDTSARPARPLPSGVRQKNSTIIAPVPRRGLLAARIAQGRVTMPAPPNWFKRRIWFPLRYRWDSLRGRQDD
jgi:hypothetical protein